MNYTHGGDIWTAEARGAGGGASPLLDFSANISPLGLPAAAAGALRAAVGDSSLCAYPDAFSRALTEKLAEKHGVPQASIVCGNGAADLIFRLCLWRRPGRVLLAAPGFSEYARAAALAGAGVSWYDLAPPAFRTGEDILAHITEGTDMLFLTNPNNPTGLLTDRALLLRIAERCEATGTLFVVDECFIEFTDAAPLEDALAAYPHLVLLRAFTKFYAMAGLRLGYILAADAAVCEGVFATGQPWPVSTPAQVAGLAALSDKAYGERLRALIKKERVKLKSGLERLGFAVWDGAANYLLFQKTGLLDLKERLLGRGILIRSCANFRGLDASYYRACVRLPEENGRLLAALEEVS